MKTHFITLITILSMFVTPSAFSGEATEQLRISIEKLLKILRNPELLGEDKKGERLAKIKVILEERFNFIEIGKRTLGKTWNTLTPKERKEFVQVFKDLLEHTYLVRVDQYSNEDVEFGTERSLSSNKVTVETTVITNSKKIPTHYNLKKSKDQWEVYDVKIEGVSLVKNYRSQFRQKLSKATYQKLLSELKEKVKRLKN